MNDKMITLLEFDKILEKLAESAVSGNAKEKIFTLKPYKTISEAERSCNETTEARRLIETIGNPPLAAMEDLDKIMLLLGKDAMLLPEQLSSVALFLAACRRIKQYLKKGSSISPVLSSYELTIDAAQELEEEILRCIHGDMIDDRATPEIRNIRRQIEAARERVKQKLDSLLRSHPEWFMEGYAIQRNGRYTLPVKREFRRMVEGSAVDSSQTGSTIFVEPSSVSKAVEELNYLFIEEENEICRILYTLTGLVEDYSHVIKINIEAMETLDFMFAKAKLSLGMNAKPSKLTQEKHIIVNNGRHPLLDPKTAVPLKFAVGKDISAVVITGPNTGGKTVALKTVGLLSLMAQSGLHVPTDDGSLFCMNSNVLCDIGDGQSIEQNLSTFSAHMTNIINLLKDVNDRSLVLLDELGSGTDPAEGMGLAIAILEAFKNSGCLLVATTHYPEIKDFAANTPGFCNARMAFDRDSLQPLYRLELGIAGESCALHIAERLGLSKAIIERARLAAYGNSYTIKPDIRENLSTQAGYSELFKLPQENDKPPEASTNPVLCTYKPGDGIRIKSTGRLGIVYAPVDSKGNVGVQVQGKKFLINYKRIKLYMPAEQLYPDYPNYDLSIVLDTVANRKARHLMGKRHVNGNSIVIEDGEPT